MNKIKIILILLPFWNNTFCQKVQEYYFVEYSSIFKEIDLFNGKKYRINDSCYYLFKFYDDRKTMINKTEYCKEEMIGSVVTYFVPRKVKKILYTTSAQEPPYQPITIKKKVYLFPKID